MTALSVSAPAGSRGGSLTVVIAGELDVATEREFAKLAGGYMAGRVRRIVMDLSGLTFVDLAGLRAINALCEQADQRNITVVLCGVPPQLRRLIKIIEPARRLQPRIRHPLNGNAPVGARVLAL